MFAPKLDFLFYKWLAAPYKIARYCLLTAGTKRTKIVLMPKTDLLTVPMFAQEVGVSRFTVLKWVQSGKVKGFKKDPFNGRTSPIFIPVSEVERVLKLMKEAESQADPS